MTVKFIIIVLCILLTEMCNGQQLIPRRAKSCSGNSNSYCLLGSELEPTFFCEGTLIKLNWILTSASCGIRLFEKKNNTGNVFAWVGVDKLKDNKTQGRIATKYVVHKEIKERDSSTGELERSDLVLIQLNESFKKTDTVDVVKLPPKKYKCRNAEITTMLIELSNTTQEDVTYGQSRFWQAALSFLGLEVLNKITDNAVDKAVDWAWNGLKSMVKDCIDGKISPDPTIPIASIKKRETSSKCKNEQSKLVCPTTRDFCVAEGGGPVFCKDRNMLIAMEKKCIINKTSSGPKANKHYIEYIKIGNYLDFIAKTVGDNKKPETSTEKPSAGAPRIKKRNKMLLAVLFLICFIKFSF